MKQKQCTNLQKPSSFWRSLFLFFSGLILLPIALVLILIRRSLLLVQKLCIRRPMIKEPIRTIRLEAMETEDYNDEQKKTQEWLKNFDNPLTLSNARYIAEYNFHLPNEQNNEQTNLKKFPDVDYDDAIQ
ncbi:MAG: hypothetical protein CL557_12885 [Alphaproteobacteria bacterium]|nr:hypothetical protein [Alphaproteobacteria bacterium]